MASAMIIPQKPNATEYLNLMGGPRVEIIVGKEKKHYSLPRDLLSYYSTYFHCCFNGAFKEAKEQKLELVEDTVEDFEILLEYMLHHSVPTCTEAMVKEKGGVVAAYMSIISYADKYAMGSIFCDLLYGKLEERLSGYARANARTDRTTPENAELVFRLTQTGSPMRTLVVRDALSTQGLRNPSARFKDVEEKVPHYALEMLQQIRLSVSNNGGFTRESLPFTDLLTWYHS